MFDNSVHDLPGFLSQVESSTAKAKSDVMALTVAATKTWASLESALMQAQRVAALLNYDKHALKEFMDKPYVLRPLGEGEYELIVPRFLGLSAGWPMRHDGAYSVYLVSRFTNFINPAPGWLADELGFQAPAYRATLEDGILTVEGDAELAYNKLGGAKTIVRREGQRLILRPASRFDILRRIIREEGILPYKPQPIPAEYLRPPAILDEAGNASFTLRPHQARDFERFLQCGAVSVFAYPQTGKTFLALFACAALKGPKLIIAPRRSLVAQWKARLELYLTPEAAKEVTVSTYQGAGKLLKKEWTLFIPDECHHIPADFAIEAASTIKTVARMGLSATPRREDGQTELIPALCGWPLGADWPVSAAQKPPVTVWVVKNESEKLKKMEELCARPVDGKTFIFTYRLNIGEKAAKRLGVPFVQGKTKRPLDVMRDNDMVVVSSVGNEGLSFPVRRVVEIDWLFSSQMEAGQRLGRLAYEITGKDKPGEHHILMTPDELKRYGRRLLIYEQWGLSIDIRFGEDEKLSRVLGREPRQRRAAPVRRVPRVRASASAPVPDKTPPAPDSPEAMLRLPVIAAKVAQAEKSIGQRSAPYIKRCFRYCYTAALSSAEIAEGLGITDAGNRSRINSACKALVDVGLAEFQDDRRVRIRQDEVQRLQALAGLREA
jgi:hypothetical protein